MVNPKVRVRRGSSTSTQAPPLARPASSTQTTLSSTVSEDEVRMHAYQLYERRGGSGDHAVADWLRAEAQLTARRNRANKTLAG